MAIRALNSVVVANYDTAASASWQAGAALRRDTTVTSSPTVALATRVILAGGAIGVTGGFVGFSADDTARSGNTMILSDPVGSSYVDNNGALVANNGGFYSVSKRAIGDFQAEIVNGVTNPTAAGSAGFEGPRRGVGVYNTPGGQFVTDQFKTASTASSVSASAADAGTAVYAPGALLTVAVDGTGKLVELGVNQISNAAMGNTFPVVGVVDRYDSAAGLLYFTQK
jgi:hypothetical protein